MTSYAKDQLIEVRFHVFFNHDGGPVLSCRKVENSFTPVSFSDRGGRQFGSTRKMAEALDSAGLPGEEIETFDDKSYFVTVAQLEALGMRD
jgi:hypothetical protein